MAKSTLSIIYINYKSTNLLIDSFSSLKEKTTGLIYEIIIVDYSNDKGLKDYAQKKGTTYIPSENKGFGAGNNLAAQYAKGNYLLFLNPDTLVVDNSIYKMTSFLERHLEIGALSPLLYNVDGQLQKHFYADNMSLLGVTFGRWKGRTIDLKQEFVSTGMVSGAAMMIRADLFKRINGFDEKFFMYLEDDDLCLRLNKLGYQNAVLTDAKVIHLEGRSSASSDKKKWYYRSQDYYFRKHYGLFIMLIMKLIRLPYIWFRPFDK